MVAGYGFRLRSLRRTRSPIPSHELIAMTETKTIAVNGKPAYQHNMHWITLTRIAVRTRPGIWRDLVCK